MIRHFGQEEGDLFFLGGGNQPFFERIRSLWPSRPTGRPK